MHIRGITKADFDEIVAIFDRWMGGPSSERVHPVFYYELGQHALIAEEANGMVGFLLGFLTPAVPVTGYVHLVGIHPDYRRQGIGKCLYQAFAERCKHVGAAQLKAIASVGHETALRFHSSQGFSVREDPDYAGRGYARLVFSKDL
jgi:GNAT superfamily N-acetyltransferase